MLTWTTDELSEVPKFDYICLFRHFSVLIEASINADSEQKFHSRRHHFVNIECLVMDLEPLLDLHTFCRVEVFDILPIFRCFTPQKQEKHIKVDHSENKYVLHRLPSFSLSRNDFCIKQSDWFQVAHLKNYLFIILNISIKNV